MKFPGIITFSLLFILVTRIGYGQPIWSLDDCIQYALEHNIEFKRSGLNVQANEVIVLESKLLRLPSLNSSISHSYNFGRSIDPTTNDFETRSIQSNFVGLNSSIVLWNGWRQQNTLKRSKIDLEVSLEQQEGVAYNITMDVLRYYLQILVNLENVEIAKNQLALSEEQIVRTIILVDVGKLAENALLDIKAQVAADEVLLVKALNNLDLSYLDIRLLLNLELDTPF
ncbi:MAG: TolC family protein, partial [Bacteroidetes bacterium]|nr:TolC family protein [Bacteroidota bacterium]